MKTRSMRTRMTGRMSLIAGALCLAWIWSGAALAQTPAALLSKLKRLERNKKIHHQHARRHAALTQKYERMVRMHKSESKRYSRLHTQTSAEITKVYLALSKQHKALATRYSKMARSAVAKASRDKRNASSHMSTARRYQKTAIKHAQLAYTYAKKSGKYKHDLALERMRKQKALRNPTGRTTLGNMPKIRSQVLAPSKRR